MTGASVDPPAGAAARNFWRDVLRRGGTATIARWDRGARPELTSRRFPLSPELPHATRELADRLGTAPEVLLLGAHAKVVGSLTGEGVVRVGYDPGGRALPCVVDLDTPSWRVLVEQVSAFVTAATAHRDGPIDEVRAELGLVEPLFDSIVAGPGRGLELLAEGALFRVALDADGLTMRWRTDLVDADRAARIAGYHTAALGLLCADPEAPHRRSCLLSESELRYQHHELAGRPRRLPDRRWHELFEAQARRTPHVVAAVCGNDQVTYRELDTRADRAARALLRLGHGTEDVVAICADRGIDWMAAVIAVAKAGCVYLPIEPRLPPARAAAMLSRSGCRRVLTDRTGREVIGTSAEALPLEELFLTDDEPPWSLDVSVAADTAAYIYFTSGSTGEPKGAVCEHAGLLNHLLAKVEDLRIGAGTRVAQTAEAGFDISLWQLVAALLVGGTTVLLPQSVVLDVGRLVAELDRRQVAVLQVVPLYLEVLLDELAHHPRPLPALRFVSVTGEALRFDLVRRWFEQLPQVRLVNAYGATEASDDTTHEIMDRAPERPPVSLGRPIPGAEVRVVDADLSLVPLGAPGEIVFSGVCVGRGYINDDERTRLAFVADPYRPGGRMYRTGDFGRWAPTGRLEFLGRRDHQVKVRGHRIEIGETEEQLLRVPGVRAAAVLVTDDRPGRDRSLVACYTSAPSLPADSVVTSLRERLPDYMVPAHFFWLDTLPVTGNGKADRKALAGLVNGHRLGDRTPATPRTAAEQRLATAWADVLGITADQVANQDNFFDHGGTSLSALRLVLRLDGDVSLVDVTRHPVLADLARVLDHRGSERGTLLHTFGVGIGPARARLVCFPYAGGGAVNYLPLARALAAHGVEVHAVEPSEWAHPSPSDDSSLSAIAAGVATAVCDLPDLPILLWGHSSGSALAVAAAHALRERGRDVSRVFVGAQLLGSAAQRRRSIAETTHSADIELMAEFEEYGGHTELRAMKESEATTMIAAYRRDSIAADRYFLGLLENPPPRLNVPLSVVLAADDTSTRRHHDTFPEWHTVSAQVDLHVLHDGGHYFISRRATTVASLVLAAVNDTNSARARLTGPARGPRHPRRR